jgi:hypothetical protein
MPARGANAYTSLQLKNVAADVWRENFLKNRLPGPLPVATLLRQRSGRASTVCLLRATALADIT